ncbi:MAG TPA: hypothetical protein VK783_00340 [Bacteroidia bacterium]|nr:hypothetical protein [Bacteroidia bacterium]
MKRIIGTLALALITTIGFAQKAYDPCQKLDTNKIKDLLIGTWVEVGDTAHRLVISPDTLAETVIVTMNGAPSRNQSYWSYKFIDNFLSTDAVTCYSLREYKDGYGKYTDVNINSIDEHFMLLGASGKKVFQKK